VPRLPLRTIWSEPGAGAYLACLSTMRAKSREAFSEALRRWKVPTVNQVYADTSGTIAWMAAGLSPIRANWDGLLPAPGDGRYEWQGFHRAGDLPHRHDPPEGYIATANEQNVRQDWPVPAERIGFEWIEGSRAQRIAEVLAAGAKHSVASSCALQTDLVSIPARRLLRLLATLDGAGAAATTALRLLRSWDAILVVESAAAALFEVWWSKHLRPALMDATASAVRPMLGVGDVETVLARLEDPENCAVPGTTSARDRLLVDTLATAFAECESTMGADPQTWAWGRLHHAYFEHPATALGADMLLDVGALGDRRQRFQPDEHHLSAE
jgi:penicillin G amidase